MWRKIKKAGTLFMVGAMAASTASTAVPYNVMTAKAATTDMNETFDDADPTGYVRGEGTLTVVEEGRTGKALKLSDRGANWHTYAYNVSAYAGAKATIKAYMKTEDEKVVCEVTGNDGSKDYYNWLINANTVDGEWTELSGEVTIPEGAKELYFSTGSGTADYLIDDISIEFETQEASSGDIISTDYTFDKLTVADQGGTGGTIEIDEATGAMTITMTKQYGQVFFRLPEELDKLIVTDIALNVTEGTSAPGLSPKLLTQGDFESSNRGGDVGVAYGSNTLKSGSDELGKNARYLGIMTTNSCSEESPVIIKLDSVTINAKTSEKKIHEKKDLLGKQNGDFETETGWTGGEYVAYSDEDPAAREELGSKYMKVAADSTLTLDGVDKLVAGGTYDFAYWVKADADATVDLAVKATIDGEEAAATVKYDDEYELSDKWQKVSGTFVIPGKENIDEASNISISFSGSTAFAVDKLQVAYKVVPGVEKDLPDLYKVVKENSGIERMGVAVPTSALNDEMRMELVYKHYNSVTCENEMKPESILGSNPTIGEDGMPVLNFDNADAMCDAISKYNEENNADMKMRGHVFVWHSQTPTWWFREDFKADGEYVDKKEMNRRISWYIQHVGEHFDEKYPGLIYAWDVVNEQASDNGGIRMGTDWAKVYGGSTEYIIEAFKAADAYLDKDTILFYNDYNECTPAKRDTIVGFLEEIKEALGEDSTRKIGAGMQGHHDMASPSLDLIEAAARAYANVADYVHVTELDVKSTVGYRDVDDDGTALENEYTAGGYRYKEIYEMFRDLNAETGKIQCITIWGTDDANSWLKTSNSVGGSADGKTPQYPLLFDNNYKAKPAYWAFVNAAKMKPLVKQLSATETDKFKLASPYTYKAGDADVTVKPIWSKEGVQMQITVKDSEFVSSDSITVYADLKNTKSEEANIFKKTVTAKSAKKVTGGYQTVIDIPAELTGSSKIAFDVVLQKGEERYALNDTTNNQENSSEYYAELNMKPLLVVQKGKVEIDGTIDEKWDDVKEIALDVKNGEIEASGIGKVLWDEDKLYVLLHVTDADLDDSSRNEYEQDSLELFIDELNEKASAFDDNDKQYRVSYKNLQSFNGSSCKEDYIESATSTTENGYIIEAAVQWTSLDAKAGDIIGLDLQINDAKGGSRLGTANWYDGSGNGYQNPGVYGTAILADPEFAAVEDANDLLDELGAPEYTEASKESIDAAKEAYDKLTDEQKDQIAPEKVAALEAAIEEYQKLEDEVNDVKKAVDGIGEVALTDESKKKIEDARAAYDKLNEQQQDAIEVDKIEQAEKAYKTLDDTDKAQKVIDAINAIKDVKADDTTKAAIDVAEKALAGLTDDQKAIVGDTLVAKLASTKADYLKAVADKTQNDADKKNADQAAATAVEKLISAVKANDKASIDVARKAYDALTADQKSLVKATSVAALENAEKAYAELNNKPSTSTTTETVVTPAKETVAKVTKVKVKKKKVGSKTKLTVTYKAVKGCKYQIQISTNKNFKKAIKKISSKKTKVTYSKNYKGKKVYVRVRAYKKINGKNVYGKWSSKKSSKTYK